MIRRSALNDDNRFLMGQNLFVGNRESEYMGNVTGTILSLSALFPVLDYRYSGVSSKFRVRTFEIKSTRKTHSVISGKPSRVSYCTYLKSSFASMRIGLVLFGE